MPAAAAPGTLRAAKYAQRALTEQPALAAMGAHLRPYRPMADMIGGAYLPSHVDTVARQRRSAVLGAVAARPRATGAAAGLRDLIVLLPAR